jgi:hypothetical protein
MSDHCRLVRHALELMKTSDPDFVDDARQGAPLGNSTIGGIMALTLSVPRQYAEAAVLDALDLFDKDA